MLVWSLLAIVWLLDALRMRSRLAAIPSLSASDLPVGDEHRFLVAHGVALDEETRRAASAHARANGLAVLDLVPGDLPTARLLGFLQSVDPASFRRARLARGRSAGHAILVESSVLERARIDRTNVPLDSRALSRLAARLKQHACTEMDFAAAPRLRASPSSLLLHRALAESLFGDFLVPVMALQALFAALALAGPFMAPWAGPIALAALHAQALLVCAGGRIRPRDLFASTLLRAPRDLLLALALGLGLCRGRPEVDRVEEHRGLYRRLLENGLDAFFEARRTDCPLCNSTDLAVRLSTADLLQHKPGRFVIERCRACGHHFQNPRLSLAGLDFYYRDFYDGLGEEGLEAIFSHDPAPYLARARAVAGLGEPKRWLDVGTGHGHFCTVAREVFPATVFDGLDLSDGVEEARRRRFVNEAFRGLFPELASALSARPAHYDVVSMSHYLEHTRDPREELRAAATVLPPGGLLMIEVPDPESPLGTLLGRHWIPWFQPQHQHLLSTRALEGLLRGAGFEPVLWHRAEAHQAVDLLFAGMVLIGRLSPPDAPWLPPRSPLGKVWNRLVWWGGAPALALLVLADKLLAPVLRRAGWSNTYRVVARRSG
jgi:SAM-dependent methyltransferase